MGNLFGEPLDNEIRRTNDDVDRVIGPYEPDPILQQHYETRQPLANANYLITERSDKRRSDQERLPNQGMTDWEIVSRIELVRHWEKHAKRQRLIGNLEYAMIVAICILVITVALVVFGPK